MNAELPMNMRMHIAGGETLGLTSDPTTNFMHMLVDFRLSFALWPEDTILPLGTFRSLFLWKEDAPGEDAFLIIN